MSIQNFCSPHVHVQSLDSASTPEAFAKKELELGTGVLTCTDHGSLSAAYKVYEIAKKNNLIPCIGLEYYFRDDNCPILTKFGIPKTGTVPRGSDKDKWLETHPNGSFVDYNKYYHGTLGFQTYEGYLKGVKILSRADDRSELHGTERKALFTWDDIEELAACQTTLGSGCLVGMVSRHLTSGEHPANVKLGVARAYFDRLHSLFKERFFVEVFPHVCSHNFVKAVFIETPEGTIKVHFDKWLKVNGKEVRAKDIVQKKDELWISGVKNYHTWQDYDKPRLIKSIKKQEGFVQNECSPWSPNGDVQFGVNQYMIGIAKKYNIPILVSDDSHFTNPEQKLVQDVRLAQMGGAWKFYGSYHRQSSQEAFEYFKQHNVSEATFESWINNSYKWAEGFKNFKFDKTIQLPDKFFPDDVKREVKRLIVKHGRMPSDPRYLDRLKLELTLFNKNGKVDLLSYLLLAEEVTSLYARQGVLTGPARGSAAGTLLAYLLGITHVDPIKYNLSLDRFLTLDRIQSGKLPDIDQDLPSRDLLCGYECDTIEFEAEDGTKHVVPADFKVETTEGSFTVTEVIEKNLDIKAWW